MCVAQCAAEIGKGGRGEGSQGAPVEWGVAGGGGGGGERAESEARRGGDERAGEWGGASRGVAAERGAARLSGRKCEMRRSDAASQRRLGEAGSAGTGGDSWAWPAGSGEVGCGGGAGGAGWAEMRCGEGRSETGHGGQGRGAARRGTEEGGVVRSGANKSGGAERCVTSRPRALAHPQPPGDQPPSRTRC